MKLSLDWLSEFVAWSEKDPQRIAERLTLGTAEVERVEVQGAFLHHCVVGEVLTVGKHPNADMLFLCDVKTDRGVKRVVCGGANLRPFMRVAFAHVGATVKWHGGEPQELKKAKIRGMESEGMICAAGELGLEEMFPSSGERTVVDLAEYRGGNVGQWKTGQPLQDTLGLTDVIFHIDNNAITHRPDLFSHVGFARECVALGLGKWKKKLLYQSPRFPKAPLPFRCRIDIRSLVPRYCACLIRIENLGQTPPWMVQRLQAVGYRSLSLPVDITNYVAAEVGMPIHSFDADDIRGDVHFRLSRRSEKIITLDGIERALPENAIVLSDDSGIFDLMGVMGGLRSSTKEGTKRIYLHAAVVDPLSIRRTVKTMNHRTDASTIYEKGIPCVAAEQGFFRALHLFLAHAPGAQIVSRLESYGDNGRANPIPLSLERVSNLLGKRLSSKEATKALHALDFVVNQKLVVRAPLHRLGDIHEEMDLSEEIARIARFENFAPELPPARITLPTQDHHIPCLRETLKELGFAEVVLFAFLGESLLRKVGMYMERLREVENPLGEDIRYMRPSLLPLLLETAQTNIGRSEDTLRLFEVGRVFPGQDEHLSLTLLLAQKHGNALRDEPLLHAKAAATRLLSEDGFPPQFRKLQGSVDPFVHPARFLEVSVGGVSVGSVYEVHPAVCRRFDLPHRTAIATLDLTVLLAQPRQERIYREISDFPEISYDVTVSAPPSREVASLLLKIQGFHALLREAKLIDIFQKGTERHLTFRCTYGAPDRTLTEEEVKPVHEKVEMALRSGSA